MKLIKEYRNRMILDGAKISVIVFLIFAGNLKAQPGSLDLSFNGSGKFISGDIGNSESLALQSDGKIILGGSIFSSDWSFGFKRCNADGTIDNTFGINGTSIVNISPNLDFGSAIAIQTDDKIVLAGRSDNGTNDDIVVVRLNSDGTIDNTFGTNGIVTTTISAYSEVANAIAIQSDGKIVVGGVMYDGISQDFILIRYNTNGTLDNTFGVNGIVLTDVGLATNDNIKGIVLQSDGKIVAGGIYDNTGYDFCLIRYNTDGSLDNAFGNSGKVITAFTSGTDEFKSLAIQSDGKIVTVGNSFITANIDFVLMRYNTNGSLDNTFGNLGIVTSPITTTSDYAESVKIQSNGKIVVMGTIALSSDQDALLVRYNSNGTVDNSFGIGGAVISTIGSTYDFVLDGILDNTGKIILGGNFENNMGAARFIGACNLDNSVTQNGVILTSNQTGTHQWLDCNNSMAQLSNETGQSFTATVNGGYAVQISSNGCVDTTACISITNVGINDIEVDANNFSIYPNPSNGEFTIESIQEQNLEILDQLGQVIKKIDLNKFNHLSYKVIGLKSGIYFIKSEKGTLSKKVIIQ